MKWLVKFVMAIGFAVALSSIALAQNGNVATGGERLPCAFGSCFVPLFSFNGDVVAYSSAPAGPRVEFADCCLDGDSYVVFINGSRGTATVDFVSLGPLNGDCSTGPYLDSYAAEVTGASEIRYKALGLPGGVPASAYIRMQGGGWAQTAGFDSCGF
jgi:hypothetical protein